MSKKQTRTTFLINSIIALLAILIFFSFSENTKENDFNLALNSYNFVLGTQTVGSKYKFTDETVLVETAKQIKAMGSNLLKFSMHPRYCTENYNLPKNDNITSLTKLAILEPSIKEVLDMDFKYYHIWVYGFSQYTPEPPGTKDDTNQIKFINGYPEQYQKAMYQEIYEFTSYLLNKFSGSEKIFYLGNWEGDWHLRSDYDRTKPVNENTLKGMTKWMQIRQQAIDDAKRDVKHHDVEVYHYIEVNLVKKALNQPNDKVVANTIVNVVNPDYVSYSSYDSTNPYNNEEDLNKNLRLSLDYLESQLSPKKHLPKGKRVWIGEYGNPSIKYDNEIQNKRSIWTIKTALEWGAPFVLYWEMYNNEVKPDTGEHAGYWLIDNKGFKQPIWHTHHNFYNESKAFLKRYFEQHNSMPPFEVFRAEALKFNSLNL